MIAPTLYVSRPKVLIGGQINSSLSLDVLSVLVEETIEGLYRCEATFNNYGQKKNGADYIYFNRDILDFGQEFAIQLGTGDTAGQVFQGRISCLEAEYPPGGGGGLLTVLAEDLLQDLRMTRRTRTFEDESDESIITTIAQEYGLLPDLSLDGPTYNIVAQVNQSDLAFIRERTRSINAELWVEGQTLFAKSRNDRIGQAINLAYGINLLSFSVRADLTHQCTEVGVTGWDVAAKDTINETATQTTIEQELDGTPGGSAILEQAFGERKEYVVHTIPLTSEEARHIAEARYRERARRFITGTGVADGDARIRVGKSLNITGLGDLFNGKYYVTRVRHSYDSTYGFRTEFDVERPGLGQPE